MKRVLVLHGHSESAHLFGRKFKDIQDTLKDEVDFVFIDAPHLLTPVDPPGVPIFSTSEESSKFKHMDPKSPTKHTPRAWYYYLRDAHDVWAVSQSIVYLRDVLEKSGPYHGIMGYSQGGAMAALVTGLLEFPDHIPHFRGIRHPPMEFCVSFSSFLIPKIAFGVPKNVRTPTLFVVGENDALVPPEVTHTLSKQFCNVRLEIHNGGHFVPRKPEWRAFLVGFLRAFATSDGNACSPSTASESPLFSQKLREWGSDREFTPSTGIPFPLPTTRNTEDAKKLKAREAASKARRTSWTEVVPKTSWEHGLGFGFDELEAIDEMITVERDAMEPVRFDADYRVGTPKAVHVAAKFHSLEEEEAASSVTDSGPGCHEYRDYATSKDDASTRAASVTARHHARGELYKGTRAIKREDSLESLLRVQTIGGREIVVQSSYHGDDAPFDFEIDLEGGRQWQ